MCRECGYYKSKMGRFGNLCYRCFLFHQANSQPNKIEQIERRKGMRFPIREEIIEGRLVKIKICPPASAEGCRSGLKTLPFMEHAKTPKSAKGKYRRS